VSFQSVRLCTYIRVSTAKQAASQLGLEAQRAAVRAHAKAGGNQIIAEFVEVESGGNASRPQLAAALTFCRLHGATLIIAKLDRLARQVSVIAALLEGDVPFRALDAPHANKFTLHVLAAMAEHEREMISERTKAALAAAKARGVRLGSPAGARHLLEGCREAAHASAASRRAKADNRASAVAPLLTQLAAEGVTGARAIAIELNRRGVPAPSGGAWYPQQVRRTETALGRLA
jgi:DNA invertase Pin-like site-specific DNA recombinase